MPSVFAAARDCLHAQSIDAKLSLTHAASQAWQAGLLSLDNDGAIEAIPMPGRPARPALVEPRALPKRGFGTELGRASFIHAIAHIEFNAIDLAWDAVYRFRDMPRGYYADWIACADDEARHFAMLQARLNEYGFGYGDFDAHNGLWEMAVRTAQSVLVRMALVPRVLEARGLDVTPGMIVKLRSLGDDATADILEVILSEEIAHVAAGSKWFRHACEAERVEPQRTFARLLEEYAKGSLFGPFNAQARRKAGFTESELAALTSLT